MHLDEFGCIWTHWALQLLVRQEHRIYPVCAFTNGQIGLDGIGRAFRAADAVAQQVVSSKYRCNAIFYWPH